MRRYQAFLTGAVVIAGAACSEATSTRGAFTSSLSAALASVPVGYGDLTSSYVGLAASHAGDSTVWVDRGHEGGRGGDGMMGGGLDAAFAGGIGFGPGGRHGPFGDALGCAGTYSASTGFVTCTPVTLRNGLVVSSSARYADATGAAQQAFDTATTNVVEIKSTVSGTVTLTLPNDSIAGSGARGPDGPGRGHGEHGGPGGRLMGDTARIISATTTVQNASDRTVSGLAQGSTARTVNGVSSGSESTTGTSSRGAFTATRTVGDTTQGLIVPVRTAGTPAYPTAGTVIRSMSATLSYTGATPTTITRREVVTYDGSATAQVTITENGTTKTCTRPLPHGRLACQ